jgi:hypothetical protein
MGYEQFIQRFPEFETVPAQLARLVLREAKSEIDPKTWGKKYVSGVGFLAAHKLACSPLGEPVRLEAKEEKTIYLQEYERMLKSLSFGFLVV